MAIREPLCPKCAFGVFYLATGQWGCKVNCVSEVCDGWYSCGGFAAKAGQEKKEGPACFEEAVDQVLAELREVMIAKQHDYGPGNIMAFGEKGVVVRASDKMERLKNLLWNSKEPKNESVEDSWTDLANYAIIAKMLRRGTFTLPFKEGKE